jgi:hypothetical protein
VILGFFDLATLIEHDHFTSDVTIEDILQGKFLINNKKIITFGSKMKSFLGNLFFFLEFELQSYSIKIRSYSLFDTEIGASCMYVIKSVLQNI